MSKIRKKLAKFFFKLADKFDSETVSNELFLPLNEKTINVTMYDRNNIERIHAQQMVTNFELDTYHKMDGFQNFVEERTTESLFKGVLDEIIKNHKDSIVKSENLDGIIYSIDLYICKPTISNGVHKTNGLELKEEGDN